jgi:hypothetical protein
MTSAINPNNINGAYPVAGQDNNSQGFRDNFTNTSTNFQYAAQEITDLQSKVIVNSQLSGGATLATQNNMLNSPLTNALVANFAYTVAAQGVISGAFTVNYAAGHYQTVTLGASASLGFSNWPIAGQAGVVSLQVTVTNTAYTLTFPAAVSVNTIGVQGLDPATNIMEFAATGVYTFTFVSSNGGTTITLSQVNQTLEPFNASSESLASAGAASLVRTTSYFTTAGTATLADGVEGQIKVFTQTAAASMVITVADAGWKSATPGTSGTITLSARGSGCTLQYTNSVWYCIGNNGAVFA